MTKFRLSRLVSSIGAHRSIASSVHTAVLGSAAYRPLLVAAAIAGGFVHGAAFAFDPFTVRDIRVEGIQRTDAGTVFSYLPVKVGETFNDEKATAALEALYATGFFKDVRIDVDKVSTISVGADDRPDVEHSQSRG